MATATRTRSSSSSTTHSDLAKVVDRTALIENMLNQVITNYCAPQRDVYEFFWPVMLDSSVMSIGSKVRVTLVIAQRLGLKISQKALHNVMTLRNAFAHHGITDHAVVTFGRRKKDTRVHYELQIFANSGKLVRKTREVALAEFDAAYTEAKEALRKLLVAIPGLPPKDAA